MAKSTVKSGKQAATAKPKLTCTPKRLPTEMIVQAANVAIEINPVNRPPIERLARVMRGFRPNPQRLSVLTTKYWGAGGVELSVGFLDNPPANLRRRILSHMNAWGQTANVRFRETRRTAEVRIARMGGEDGGYWSYLGTDILSIPVNEPTMNLEGFTMATQDSEFHRVVRHEAGHTLGFPHEHMRRALVAKIDRDKAILYFRRTDGWTAREVEEQVLTPIEESSLLGTVNADPNSIMCYQIPGEITLSGEPILGGDDINASDFAFVATIYPKPAARRGLPGRGREARGGSR